MQYKKEGFLEEKALEYGFAPTPYGEALVVFYGKYLVALAFVEENKKKTLEDMKTRLKAPLKASGLTLNAKKAADTIEKIKKEQSVPMILTGTDFFHKVWQALLKVPAGKITSYGALARAVKKPKAARAIGQAMNKNKIAWLVPCHRVLTSTGKLGGYRYGLAIKQKMLEGEGAL